ncbi:MAG: hypothetical protein ACM30G_19670 [Micromonosporaceae bacterium]
MTAGWPDRLRRLVRHEWTVASLGALALAVVMTWPTLRHPWRTIPQDIGDPTLQAWQIAWGGHALLTDPVHLWHSNTFYPEPYTYAYSDTLLGYALFGMIGGGPGAAVFRYNILYVLLHALAFVGAYALARQLGAARGGSAVAGAAFAYAPWRLAQAGHMHVLSTGGIALALAMLARGHGWSLREGYRPDRVRPGWALAGWLVAAWQVTLGFGIGLPFAYVLIGVCLVAAAGYAWSRWRRGTRPPFPGRLLRADLAGGVVFAGITLLMARPYLQVVELHPESRRTIEWVALFSPPLRGLFIAPAESWLWGARQAAERATLGWPAEMTLLPGLVVMCLASAGLFFSVWRPRHRALLVTGVVVSAALAMGTQFAGDGDPGYATLFRLLPGWDGLRTSGRLVVWTTLLLAVLAAGTVTAVTERARAIGWRAPAVVLATVIPLAFVLVEGVNRTPHVPVPAEPAAMHGVAGPVLVLPSDGLSELSVMLWSTDGFPKIVNGLASFTPASQQETRDAAMSFPDPASVGYLRAHGIRTVLVVRQWLPGTPWQEVLRRPVDGLGITREDLPDAVVFHLS